MNKAQLQSKLDLQKWYDSEQNGCDMCGAYSFCKYCDKSNAMPCATAYEREDAEAKKQEGKKSSKSGKRKAANNKPAKDQNTSLGKKFNYEKVLAKKAARKSLTFAEKYALASEVLKDRYAKLQAALTAPVPGAVPIKSRISKQCDTYRQGGKTVAKITIIGTSLRLNLPLDPNAPEFCDGKTPHTNTGHKRVYEEVPFQFKVNSKLGLKRALALIELIK